MYLPIKDAKLWAEQIYKHIQEEKWNIEMNRLSLFDIKYIVKQIEELYQGI